MKTQIVPLILIALCTIPTFADDSARTEAAFCTNCQGTSRGLTALEILEERNPLTKVKRPKPAGIHLIALDLKDSEVEELILGSWALQPYCEGEKIQQNNSYETFIQKRRQPGATVSFHDQGVAKFNMYKGESDLSPFNQDWPRTAAGSWSVGEDENGQKRVRSISPYGYESQYILAKARETGELVLMSDVSNQYNAAELHSCGNGKRAEYILLRLPDA